MRTHGSGAPPRCMLLSASLFAISLGLAMYYRELLLAAASLSVLTSSLFFHREYIETNRNPRPWLRVLDVSVSCTSWLISIIFKADTSLSIAIALFVPIIYAAKLAYLYTMKEKASRGVCGSSGLHSLVHVFGMISSSICALPDISIRSHDVLLVGMGGIASLCLYTIFAPRKRAME